MPKYPIELEFSDGGLLEKIRESSNLMKKAAETAIEYQKTVNNAARTSAIEYGKANVAAAENIATIAENGRKTEAAYKATQAQIKEVAVTLLQQGDKSKQFVAQMEKLKTLKLNGVVADLQDVEDEITGIVQDLKLTDDQFKILVDNVDAVAAELSFEEERQSLIKYIEEVKKLNEEVSSSQRANSLGTIDDSTNEGKLSRLKLQQQYDLEDLAARRKTTEELARNAEQRTEIAKLFGELELEITEEYSRKILEVEKDKLKEAAAEAGVLTREFTSAKGELKALNNAINSGSLEGEDLEKATARAAELTDSIGDVRDEINRLASDTRGLDLLADGMKTLGAGMQIAEGSAALFGDENEELKKSLLRLNAVMAISNGLSEVGEQLTKKGTLANKAATAAQAAYSLVVGSSTGALKLFRIALASTGIGLLVILLGSLVANWDKVRKSVADNSQQIFEYGKKITTFMPPLNLLIRGIEWLYNNFDKLDNIAKGAFEGLKAGFGGISKAIGSLFSGDFSGASDAFKQIGKDSAKAYNDGFKQADIDDANKALAKNIDTLVSNQKKRLAVLEAGGKDTSKLQATILNNEIKALKLAGADKDKIAEKEQELAVFRAEQSKKIADKAAEESKKRQEREAKALEDYKNEINKLNDDINKSQRANSIEAIDDSTLKGKLSRLELQQQYDLEDLAARRKITEALAKDAAQRAEIAKLFGELELTIAKDYDLKRIELEKQSRADYKKVIEDGAKENEQFLKEIGEKEAKAKIEGKLAFIDLDTKLKLADLDRELKYGDLSIEAQKEIEKRKLEIQLNALKKKKEANGLKVDLELDSQIADAKAQLDAFGKGLEKPFEDFGDMFKGYMEKAFNLKDGQYEALAEGFGALKSAILDVVNAGYEAELEALDASISEREDRVSELESLIEEEYDKKQQGYANDYDALVAKKASEEALIKEDNKKKIEIQKDQLKAETAIQAAQQIGALITAVANIFSSSSKLGIFGIPLAAAAIVSLFALFKSYKNQVKSLTAYKGGKISDYLEPGQTAKSDRPGRGVGHRVEGTNLSIGADEFLMNAISTENNLPFLREMNKGKFDKVNLMDLVSNMPNKGAVLLKMQASVNERKNTFDYSVIKDIVQEQTKAILADNEKRPIVIPTLEGITLMYVGKNSTKKVLVKGA